MKTKRDIEGQLKRLVGNTGLPLKADHNDVYGGWQLELKDLENPGCTSELSFYRLQTSPFYVMLHSMNVLIETMRQQKKVIQ